jgi:DNA-binding transcriptional regulator GbsR (MarR family)
MKDSETTRFIEEAAVVIEEHGLPHMAGRVIGALLVCVPPHMSLDELAERLRASKGSISMSTQLLLRLGVVEKVSSPAERRHFYQIRPDMWTSLFTQRTEHLNRHHDLAAEGLDALSGESVEARERLMEMLVFFDFIAEEMPNFVQRWRKRRVELMKQRMKEYG